MAGGLGARLFVSGDVITAADVNGYLMNQSMMRFATTAARDTAFGNGIPVGQTVGGIAGDGKPLLQEGMFAYIDFNNDVQYFNGSQWISAPQFVLEDGSVTTIKIADDAVTGAKIADGAITAAHIADGTIIAADIADGSVTSAKILDGTIVNADINASAAIALSKLASGTSGQIVVHSSGGVPTATTVSGDITIDSTGNAQIAADKIVNADINAAAAIALSKLATGALPTAITVASANIVDGTIVNADINASAAIAASKISGTAITAADSGTVTSTMIADGTIVNADINASAAIELGKLADATIKIETGNYTLQLTDKNKFIKMNITSTANTVTVPLDSTVNFPEGAQIHIIQYGTGKTQIVGATGSVNIYRTPGSFLRDRYSSATLLKCAAANTWMLMGDLSAS